MLPELIETDVVRLRQILFNLIGNAVKFTDQGGVTVRVSYDAMSNCLKIAVKDTGIGIAPNNIEKLFSLFSQIDTSASRNYEGTGLGWSLVRSLRKR